VLLDDRIEVVPPLLDDAALFDAPKESGFTTDIRFHRVVTLLAALSLFAPAISASTPIIQLPLVGLISIIGFGAALGAVLLTLLCRTEQSLRRLDGVILGLALVLLGAWAASELYLDPVYGTDEAAFVQYSAQLLLHGHNPYSSSMLPSLTQFQVPIQYATYLLNGGISKTFAYPSLAFLVDVPFNEITDGVQSVIVANIFFLAVELIVLFALLPRRMRGLAPVLVLGLPILFGYTVGGVIDTFFVPFLLVVAYRWSDIGRGGSLGRREIVQGVCFGLAVSFSQFPWFLAPFLLLGIWCCRRSELGSRRATTLTAQFVGIALATAFVVNLPFIVWSPEAWLKGVMTPLLQHAVPFGQGIVAASVFFRIGGGNLALYSLAASVIFCGLMAAYVVWFTRLWRLVFILPSLVLYFPARSLTEYVVTVIGVWTISVVVPGAGPTHTAAAPRPRPRGLHASAASSRRFSHPIAILAMIVLAVIPAIGLLVDAMATPAPLALKILSVNTNGQFERVWEIRVSVTNHSHATIEPHFTAHSTSQLTPFWDIRRGPTHLKAGQEHSYDLVAPNVGSMPVITQPFVVQAVTPQPETISSSALFTPQSFSCYISPSYVDQAMPLGKSVTLDVELRSPLGEIVDRPGVPVALGQIIYGQRSLIPSEASINGAPEGQTPVVAKTKANGIAVFHVRDSTVQGSNPVYFQAYVQPKSSFAYGYSEIVSIVWQPK
jgi:uncharacterized membrane protein